MLTCTVRIRTNTLDVPEPATFEGHLTYEETVAMLVVPDDDPNWKTCGEPGDPCERHRTLLARAMPINPAS
jgi:hypothetical protein